MRRPSNASKRGGPGANRGPEGDLRHDVINASIANQRVSELVETAETRRTVRDRGRRPEAAKPVRPVVRRIGRSGVTPALLRVLRGVM